MTIERRVDLIWEWFSNEWALLTGSAVVGGIVTHIFYRLKLKIEQKIRFQNTIGDEIVSSLTEIRSITKTALQVEVYDVENELNSKGIHFKLKDSKQYPAFMYSKKTFLKFHTEIMTLREKYSNNINQDIAVYILYAEQYISTLMMLAAEYEEDALHDLGTIVINDIHKWQISFDKTLIKQLNSPPLKLELHTGIKWRLKKKILENKLWKKSTLYKIVNGIIHI